MKKQQPIEVHMLAKGLAFPIAIFIYQGEEKATLQYLLNNRKLTSFTSYDICVWCKNHGISYRIAYPMKWTLVLQRPWKLIAYAKLRYRLSTL